VRCVSGQYFITCLVIPFSRVRTVLPDVWFTGRRFSSAREAKLVVRKESQQQQRHKRNRARDKDARHHPVTETVLTVDGDSKGTSHEYGGNDDGELKGVHGVIGF